MRHPNPWNPGAAGSHTWLPGQDSGGGPDGGQSQTGLVCARRVGVEFGHPWPCGCSSGLSAWEAEGVLYLLL